MSYFTALASVILSINMELAYSDTMCNDAYACEDETIDSTACCTGYYACDESTITSSESYLHGAYAATNATIESESLVVTDGYRSIYYSSVSTDELQSLGYYGFQHSHVEPYSSGSTLKVYLYGYFGGYGSDLSCYEGNTCQLYCGSSQGCNNFKFYCYSGATCYYNCDDDPNYCPTLYGGVSSTILSGVSATTITATTTTTARADSQLNPNNVQIAKHAKNVNNANEKLINTNINERGLHPSSMIGISDDKITELKFEAMRVTEAAVSEQLKTGMINSDLTNRLLGNEKETPQTRETIESAKRNKNNKINKNRNKNQNSNKNRLTSYDSDDTCENYSLNNYNRNNAMDNNLHVQIHGVTRRVTGKQIFKSGMTFFAGAFAVVFGKILYNQFKRLRSRTPVTITHTTFLGYMPL